MEHASYFSLLTWFDLHTFMTHRSSIVKYDIYQPLSFPKVIFYSMAFLLFLNKWNNFNIVFQQSVWEDSKLSFESIFCTDGGDIYLLFNESDFIGENF